MANCRSIDFELIKHFKKAVSIPVIASSGAGKVEHFSEVFEKTKAEAALAAAIFHREEVPIEAVKEHMRDEGIERGLRRDKAELSSLPARTDKRTSETSRLIPLKGVLKRVPLRYK